MLGQKPGTRMVPKNSWLRDGSSLPPKFGNNIGFDPSTYGTNRRLHRVAPLLRRLQDAQHLGVDHHTRRMQDTLMIIIHSDFFGYFGIPSGKRLHNYGKSPFFIGKSTISMAIFNIATATFQGTALKPTASRRTASASVRLRCHWAAPKAWCSAQSGVESNRLVGI